VERKSARIARSAVCLLVAAGLAGPAVAVARDSDRAQPPRDLWEAYPLRQAPAAPAGSGATDRAKAPSDEVERLAVASVFALIAGGFATWLVTLRWRRARGAASAAPPDTPLGHSTSPELWVHSADAPTADLAAPPPPVRPDAETPALPAGSPAPPEPDRAWAAEIGWHLVDGESQFIVAARPVDGGAEPITLGASSLLEWPPRGARSVQALTDAVKALESTLVAAGWTPVPRGSAWYAKRFTWQPGVTRPGSVASSLRMVATT
jgi:hypothetical protein